VNYNEIEQLNLRLFAGLNSTDIRILCDCLSVTCRKFSKNQTIFEKGTAHTHFAVTLIPERYIGMVVADTENPVHQTDYVADDNLVVLLVPFRKLTRQCHKVCLEHGRFIVNFIAELSRLTDALQKRMSCLTKPNTREKALQYLRLHQEKYSSESAFEPVDGAGKIFTVPSRIEMAEYLNIERTALSRELSKLKKEKVIDFYKEIFRIIVN